MSWSVNTEDWLEAIAGKKILWNTARFDGFGTDTRKDLKGKLFIALKGDSFDAHDFLDKAVDAGASGILTHRKPSKEELGAWQKVNPNLSVIGVDDTLVALQNLSTFWRKQCGFGVIGITGSNGKTTTKEFLRQILKTKYKTYCSEGSLNNHWGVPFTLLNADADSEWVICEMGMNHPGEIAKLCEIAEPNIVCVTFVGRGHLEGMGSIQKVALEKSQIYEASPNAKKLYNLDNNFTKQMKEKYFQTGDICFGEEAEEIQMECLSSSFSEMKVKGHIQGVSFEKELPIYGAHNITNLMAASGLSLLAGMSSEEVVASLHLVKMAWGRNQVEKIADWTVVFDAYNANPDSMDAFLKNAAEQKIDGKKHLILGEMLELGAEAPQMHKELGETVRRLNFDSANFFGLSFKHFKEGLDSSERLKSSVISDTYEESLALKIKNMLKPNDAVFIKGSRGVHLERFLEVLRTSS